jgi:26S proteasome regulatory subunit N7
MGFGFDLADVVGVDMASLYESLAADGVLEMDAALLAEMRA